MDSNDISNSNSNNNNHNLNLEHASKDYSVLLHASTCRNSSTEINSVNQVNFDPLPEPSSSRPLVLNKIGHLRCINCQLNVTNIRRHLLEIIEVRQLIQQWVQPQLNVSSDSVVCHTCWSAAWNHIRNENSQQPVFHGRACVDCGRSVLRIKSHLLSSDSVREELIRNEIARKIAPRQLPQLCQVCHNCWRRTDRAINGPNRELPSLGNEVLVASNASTQTEQQNTRTMNCVVLPNYLRAPSTQRECFFPGCINLNRIIVPPELRIHLFCQFNYYVPPECRICSYHLNSNSWSLLLRSIYNPIKTFTIAHIEDFASLLKNNVQNHLDFENISIMADHTVHYYLGLTKTQYYQILTDVPRLANQHRGSFALAAYLMKLRTGDSDERLSSLLQVPRTTLMRLINMARELLNQYFVPENLGINHISREQIAQRNLLIPNGLFGGGDDRNPIIIADGTYIYIEKSSNYMYQKKTYSLHKYRNLIKPFLFVCSDGYIIDVLGPYPATTSDADIINNEFNDEQSSLRQYFQAGDVFILDRGFRDSLPLLNNCGYQVHVPLSPVDSDQLNTWDANRSRAVTMCRWVVEAVNGIFKTAFKIFRQNYFNRASTHVMSDFSVAAALINKFHTKITNRDDATQILERVLTYMPINNDLADYVRQQNLNRVRADFRNINVDCENVREFPLLTYNELVLLACGTYQLKQARSYYGEHIRFNGAYRIEICNDRRNILEGLNISPNCFLLRARIASRHISRKIYFVYILINANQRALNAIKKYCCNCIVGKRTVGCCAHTMTVMWYLGWARHQTNICPPAQFLDDLLICYDTQNDV